MRVEFAAECQKPSSGIKEGVPPAQIALGGHGVQASSDGSKLYCHSGHWSHKLPC